MGRIARYYVGRSLRAGAFDAGREQDWAKAGRRIRRAAEMMGPTAELTGYLANRYARHVKVNSPEPESASPEAALIDQAMAQSQTGRRLESLMTLRQAIRRHPGSAKPHLLAGMALAGQDHLDEAKRHFQVAVDCDCTCVEAYRYLGLCDASAGRFSEALRHLRRALSLNGGDLPLTREVFSIARAATAEGGDVALDLVDGTNAAIERDMERLAELILTESDFVNAVLALPVSEVDGEIFTTLSSVMDIVLARHGDYADMQYRQALTQRRLGLHDRAVAHALRAVAINGDYVQGRFLAGSLLLDSAPTIAAEHLRRAVAAGGDYADVHTTLGLAYQKIGRTDDACREMRRSLEINDSYEPAAEALTRLVA